MTVALDNAYITAENNLAVADEQAIRQVIARLNHALDAADYPLYASLFSTDAVFNTAFGRATGRDEIAAALEQSRPFITNKRHAAVNLLICGNPANLYRSCQISSRIYWCHIAKK